MPSLPVVLTIAGSDNSAGAGAQADLKTMSALGVYGVTAITCVVAEVPGKVSAIQPVEPRIVAEQVRLLFEAFPIAAMKTGMLHSRAIIDAVCDTLAETFIGVSSRPFLVVDPVMIATAGTPLLQPDGMSALRERLFPLASLVTPNLDETSALLGRPVQTAAEMEQAGAELVQTYGSPFLVKGGHLRGEARAVDLLFTLDGAVHRFAAPFVPDVATHGTGCTFSSAIASYVARGLALPEAVERAKLYVTRVLRKHLRWEGGGLRTDALHHFA